MSVSGWLAGVGKISAGFFCLATAGLRVYFTEQTNQRGFSSPRLLGFRNR
jgi:hypothetical protein